MLPLVKNQTATWPPGWCTYPDGFEDNPDIEVFCGGENHKMPQAAAVWRQGNLLHFGFEQSPAELDETGRRLLLNSIAYISRFTEDRPIAITPSIFVRRVGHPRAYLDRRFAPGGSIEEAKHFVTPALLQEFINQSPDDARKWYASARSYLHPSPGPEPKLEIDAQARSLRAPIDQPEFFVRCIAELETGNNAAATRELLARYVPTSGPADGEATRWSAWFKENRPYLFFSDAGDYRWYIDPLAKRRGLPSRELRGPARASLPAPKLQAATSGHSK